MVIMRLILFFIGGLLFCNGIFAVFAAKPNMGSVLPAVLAIPLFACAILLETLMANSFLKVITCIGLALYVLFFAFILCLSLFLKKYGSKCGGNGAKLLMILGMGLKKNKMLPTLKKRLCGAEKYLKSNPNCKILLSGGLAKGSSKTEAEAMREYLVAKGIDAERITLENESKSTYENFKLSKPIIEKMGIKNSDCVFLTNNFHVFRSQKIAAVLGMDIKGIGVCDCKVIAPNNYLRECAAIVQYVIKGKLKI